MHPFPLRWKFDSPALTDDSLQLASIKDQRPSLHLRTVKGTVMDHPLPVESVMVTRNS
jgi:hypothetical protein